MPKPDPATVRYLKENEGKSFRAITKLLDSNYAAVNRAYQFAIANGISPSQSTSKPPEVLPPTMTPTPPVPQKLSLSALCLNAGTQMRETLNLATIAEYAEAMAEGGKFPPVIVFTDGETFWLADGFQRVKAAEQVGYTEIEAETRPGTLRDATIFACGANAKHGQRRTNRDKRKAVCTLLADTEWSQWSDNHIAAVCGVSQSFTSEVRRSLKSALSDNSSERQYVNKHGTTSTMSTSNIGRRATDTHQPRRNLTPPPVQPGLTPIEIPAPLTIMVSDNGCVLDQWGQPISAEAIEPILARIASFYQGEVSANA